MYGLYEIDKNADEVYIVESPINCLTLAKWGYSSLALFGTGSKIQINNLNKLAFRKYILCLDGDEAGRVGADNIKNGLIGKIVKTIHMYDGKDVNDLTKEVFDNLVKTVY